MYPSVRAHRDQNPSVLQQSSPPPRRTWRLWLLLPLLLLSAKPLGWAQPDNDLFVHRTRLAGTDLSLLASGTDAGLEPGEPNLGGQPTDRTVWWSWTAPADGRLIVNASAEGVLWARIRTFSGDQLSNLVEIPSTAREHNVFAVAAGRDYAIQVVLQSNHEVFHLQVNFQPVTSPPVNDAFANAETLIANAGSVLGSTIGATGEASEPAGVTNSVWYVWTAPADGVAGVQALSPGPNFALFTGADLDHLNLLATQPGWIEFYCQAGVTYHVRITMRRAEDFFFRLKSFYGHLVEPHEGAQFVAEQPVTLRAELTPWDAPEAGLEFWVGTDVVGRSTNAPYESVWVAWPGSNLAVHVQPIGWAWPMVQASQRVYVSAAYLAPGNDRFEQRTFLPTLPTVLEGDARGATSEPGESAHGYAVPLHTVWYSWTASSNGLVTIGTSPFQPEVVRFYTGTLLGDLQPVTPLDVLGLRVTAGTTYQIAVDSSEARRFQVWFTVKVQPPIFNDAFSARQTLTELPITLTNVLSAATMENGEPAAPHAGEQSLWYTWQAPSNGVLTVRCDVSFVARQLFTGSELPSLTPVASRTETWNQTEFWVQAGTSYQLRISGAHTGDWLGAFSAVVWSASFEPVPANDQFETRQLLTGTSGHVLANGHLLNNGTLWYDWIAPGPGVFVSGPEASLYTGNDSSHLQTLTMTGEGIVVTQGMSIKLACRGSGGGWPDAVDYTFFPAAPNDRFADALELLGNSGTIPGHTYGAGRERGEPSHGPGFAGRTIWYRWTAPGPGWFSAAAQIAGQTPALMVYEGKALNRLKPVPNRTRLVSSEGLFAVFETPAETGKTYYVVLDNGRYRQEDGPGYFSNPPSTSELQFSFTPLQLQVEISRPAAGMTVLSGRAVGPGGSGIGDTIVGATYTFLFEDRFCPSQVLRASEPDGSLRWTNPPPGQYLVVAGVLAQSGGDRLLPTVSTVVRPDNDDRAHALILPESYQVTNDSPIGGATRERGEPNHGVGTKGGTVWWQWTAPATGNTEIGLVMYGGKQRGRLGEEPPLVPGLGVYTLKQGRLLRLGAATTAAWTATTRFKALAGTNYLIVAERPPGTFLSACDGSVRVTIRQEALRLVTPQPESSFALGAAIPLSVKAGFPAGAIARVDYLSGDAGLDVIASATQPPFGAAWNGATRGSHSIRSRLTLHDGREFLSELSHLVVLPANDNFENGLVLAGEVAQVIDSTSLSSPQPGEPKDWTRASGTSLWYRWAAPRSGPALVRLGAQFNAVFVYTGNTLQTLRRVTLTNTPSLGVWAFEATAGVTYHVSVVGNGYFELALATGPHPQNDTFAAAQRIDSANSTITGSFRLATYETGEPGRADEASVWYRWRAPADGTVAFKQPGPIINMDLYEGSSLEHLALLTHLGEEYQFGVPRPGKIYRVLRDHEYHLRVARNAGVATAFDLDANRFQIEMLFAEPPPNDAFADRTAITGDDLSIPGNLLGASSEPGDGLNGMVTGATLWWTWLAPADGLVSITSSNVGLSISQGDRLGALSGFPGHTFRVRAGQAIHLSAETYYQRFDPFLLRIQLVRPPANDAFDARTQIDGTDFFARTNTLMATRDFGEPAHAGQLGGRSVWWTWTAPADGLASLLVTNTTIEQPLLAVYQGQTLASLVPVSSALGSHFNAALTFSAQRGQQYHVAVDGYAGQYGSLDLLLHLVATAPMAMAMPRALPSTAAPSCRIVRVENGGQKLEISGAANRAVRVQISADLKSWTDWREAVIGSGDGPLVLNDPDRQPQRFYRVLLVE